MSRQLWRACLDHFLSQNARETRYRLTVLGVKLPRNFSWVRRRQPAAPVCLLSSSDSMRLEGSTLRAQSTDGRSPQCGAGVALEAGGHEPADGE